MTKSILDQAVLEALREQAPNKAFLDQVALEAAVGSKTVATRLTQSAGEVLYSNVVKAQFCQVVIELIQPNVTSTPPTVLTPVDDYPDFPQLMPASTPSYSDASEADRTVSGNARARMFSTGPKRNFRIKHLLTNSQLATLLAFYADHRHNLFTFIWHETMEPFNVFFAAEPQYTIHSNYPGQERLEVDVSLIEY